MNKLTKLSVQLTKFLPSLKIPPIKTTDFLILPTGYGCAYSTNDAEELTLDDQVFMIG